MPNDRAIARLAKAIAGDVDGIVETVLPRLRWGAMNTGPGAEIEDDDLGEAIAEVLRQYLAILQDGNGEIPAAIETVIRRRFAQGVALPDLLHAYRVSAAGVWERLLARSGPADSEILLSATPRVFEMVDRFSLRAHELYRDLSAGDLRRQEQIRVTLLDTLLYGDATCDESFWHAVHALRLPRDGHFVVVDVTTASSVSTPFDWEKTVSLLDFVESARFRLGLHSQVGLISLAASTGELEVGEVLAGSASATVGISAPFTSISGSRAARSEAGTAAAAASRARPVVRYNHDVLDVLMASAPGAADNLVRTTLGGLLDLPAERARPLVETIRVWLNEQQSISATASVMQCHRNTVNYRLKQLEKLCKRSLSDNIWLAQVTLAVNGIAGARADLG